MRASRVSLLSDTTRMVRSREPCRGRLMRRSINQSNDSASICLRQYASNQERKAKGTSAKPKTTTWPVQLNRINTNSAVTRYMCTHGMPCSLGSCRCSWVVMPSKRQKRERRRASHQDARSPIAWRATKTSKKMPAPNNRVFVNTKSILAFQLAHFHLDIHAAQGSHGQSNDHDDPVLWNTGVVGAPGREQADDQESDH